EPGSVAFAASGSAGWGEMAPAGFTSPSLVASGEVASDGVAEGAVPSGAGKVAAGSAGEAVPMLSRPRPWGRPMFGRSGRSLGKPGTLAPTPGKGAGRFGVCVANQSRKAI